MMSSANGARTILCPNSTDINIDTVKSVTTECVMADGAMTPNGARTMLVPTTLGGLWTSYHSSLNGNVCTYENEILPFF